ncbi:MAG: hypothetical protein JNK77_13925 [Saprospiraceae bacterium]|nr:hypothetical protein [Saprospiraceae bacterium]
MQVAGKFSGAIKFTQRFCYFLGDAKSNKIPGKALANKKAPGVNVATAKTLKLMAMGLGYG